MYLTFTSMLFNMWPDYRIISKPFTQVFIVLVIKASKVDFIILCQFWLDFEFKQFIWRNFNYKQLVLYPYTLSTILPSTGLNQCYGNILLYETYVISIMVSHFDYKHDVCREECSHSVDFAQ